MPTKFRVLCPKCGEVLNIINDQPCPKCSMPLSCTNQGEIQMYRMGSPIGIAVGFGIYINGMPMGHIANKESLRIVLPYGTYNIHLTCGMTRRCEDAVVTLSPECPIAYVKGAIKMGFWTNRTIVKVVTKEEMPIE